MVAATISISMLMLVAFNFNYYFDIATTDIKNNHNLNYELESKENLSSAYYLVAEALENDQIWFDCNGADRACDNVDENGYYPVYIESLGIYSNEIVVNGKTVPVKVKRNVNEYDIAIKHKESLVVPEIKDYNKDVDIFIESTDNTYAGDTSYQESNNENDDLSGNCAEYEWSWSFLKGWTKSCIREIENCSIYKWTWSYGSGWEKSCLTEVIEENCPEYGWSWSFANGWQKKCATEYSEGEGSAQHIFEDNYEETKAEDCPNPKWVWSWRNQWEEVCTNNKGDWKWTANGWIWEDLEKDKEDENDDGNNGHGNDDDGVDDSNPGNSNGNSSKDKDDDDDKKKKK